MTSEENTPPNFLELCTFCAIINFVRHGLITPLDADTVQSIYNAVIEALFALGIVLPLRKWSKESIWKKFMILQRNFEH